MSTNDAGLPAPAPAAPPDGGTARSAFDRWIGSEGTPPCPVARLLGFRLVDVDRDAGRVTLAFTPRPEFANPVGLWQGGIQAAMLDEALGAALLTRLPEDAFAPTLEMKVSYLRAAKLEPMTAVGWVVSAGRSVQFAAGELRDAQGRPVATATATSARTPAPPADLPSRG